MNAIEQDNFLELNFHDKDNQLNDCDLVTGVMLKQLLLKLFNEGDISEYHKKQFSKAVHDFLASASEYLLKWCPFNDELLSHAV